MYQLEFFETSSGRVPALEFLRERPKSVRAEAGWLLQQLERHGSSLDRPLVGYLEDGIYELRWEVERNAYRLLFFFSGRRIIVVTHGIVKKSGPVPPKEIGKARRFRAEWLARG